MVGWGSADAASVSVEDAPPGPLDLVIDLLVGSIMYRGMISGMDPEEMAGRAKPTLDVLLADLRDAVDKDVRMRLVAGDSGVVRDVVLVR